MEKTVSFAFQGALIFLYIFIFSLYSLLIRSARDGNGYNFSSSSVTMCTELFKLLSSLALLYNSSGNRIATPRSTVDLEKGSTSISGGDTSVDVGDDDIVNNGSDGGALPWYEELLRLRKYAFFAVPALLYCVYNNLIFVNMLNFDLGTYNVLNKANILFTALFSVILLSRKLVTRQWIGLVLLTIGCIAVEVDRGRVSFKIASIGALLLLGAQCLIASLASIANEKQLKKEHIDINVGNAYLYLYGIIFNIAFFALSPGTGGSVISILESFLRDITNPQVLLLSSVSAVGGIVTSRIVKFISSIAKSFATSIEMLTLVLISWAFFDTQLTTFFVIGMILVMVAVLLYSSDLYELCKTWLQREGRVGGGMFGSRNPSIHVEPGFLPIPLAQESKLTI